MCKTKRGLLQINKLKFKRKEIHIEQAVFLMETFLEAITEWKLKKKFYSKSALQRKLYPNVIKRSGICERENENFRRAKGFN